MTTGKRLCPHLTLASHRGGHWWSVDRWTDLVLCDSCHATYSQGGTVQVDSIISLVADLDGTRHKNPPAASSILLVRIPPPKPSEAELEVFRLTSECHQLAHRIALPGNDWRLRDESRRSRQLRARIEAHPKRENTRLQNAAAQLEWANKRLDRVRLAVRSFCNIVRRAERLL